jgi:hypothetical protein
MIKIQFQIILIQFLKISFIKAVLANKKRLFSIIGNTDDTDKTDKYGFYRAKSNL